MTAHVVGAREQALLDMVYRSPGDDDCRQVYADALLERGDPRGEFIMLQFKRARGELTNAEAARERQLLRAHVGAWLGGIAGVVDPDRAVFRKGFLAECALLPQHHSSEVLDREEWATVERLESFFPDVFYSPRLRSLRTVGPVPLSIFYHLADTPLPHVEEVRARTFGAWDSEDSELLRRAFPGMQHLMVCFEDAFAPEPDDLVPDRFGWALAGECGPIDRLTVKKRLTQSLRGLREELQVRVDLAQWLVRAHDSGLRAVRLEPCHGWSFGLLREDDGWRLELDWNTAAATGDLYTLRHAVHGLREHPHALALVRRVVARTHGMRRAFHQRVAEMELGDLGELEFIPASA